MNAREKHQAEIEKWKVRRPRITITTRAGTRFEFMKLDAIEVVKAFELMGVSLDGLDQSDAKAIGTKMFNHLDELIDKFVCPASFSPRIMPIGHGTDTDELSASDLEPLEKLDLVQNLMANSSGMEGQNLGESFRPDTPGAPDTGPSAKIQPATE